MPQLRRNPVSKKGGKSNNPITKAMGRAKHSSFYHDLSLRGKNPLRLLGTPEDIWPGSVTAGTQIVSGKMVGGGHILDNPSDGQNLWSGQNLWNYKHFSQSWMEYLHSFRWLKDLNQAVDQGGAKKRAEELVEGWIDYHTSWGEVSWRADIVAERVTNWLIYAPLIMDTDDVIYRGRVLDMMARSARHIMKMASDLPDGPDGLKALIGLTFSGLYIPNGEEWISKGVSLLKFALVREVLVDGGVRSRNPQELLRLFMHLVLLKKAFSDRTHQAPHELEEAISRMAVNLKSIVHLDGKLPTFNGVSLHKCEDIYSSLLKVNMGGTEQADLDQCGFLQLEKGKSRIIMDAGPPAELELSRHAHAGTHSFEMSRKSERVIINCGDASFVRDKDNQGLDTLSRGSNAHSTLIIENTDSSEVRNDGLIGTGITKTISNHFEENGHILMESEHDGYVKNYDRIHKRLIYANEDGEDIRGEDIIETSSQSQMKNPIEFSIRFHLHPDISVTVSKDGNLVYLGLVNGETWQFRQRGASLNVEDSIYFAEAGKLSQTKQIVLTGSAEKDATILWSLKLS